MGRSKRTGRMGMLLHLLQLPLLLLSAAVTRLEAVASSYLTDAERLALRAVEWLDRHEAEMSYRYELRSAEVFGRNTEKNPNRLIFRPEGRVLHGQIVTIVCLLSPDTARGYRANSVTVKMMEAGQTHKRSLLAPKEKLATQSDQLNGWNYAQESVCQPLRDCSQPANEELKTIGLVTREGWGLFQVRASYWTEAHYQCVSETQSVLSAKELEEFKLKEFLTIASNFQQLQVYKTEIGFPKIQLEPAYIRGAELRAGCVVNNSVGPSDFTMELVILRPPPAGVPGPDREELLLRHKVTAANSSEIRIRWEGERALLSHHGLMIVCRVRDDWGPSRGLRMSRGHLMVSYLFPAYVDNPRIRYELYSVRLKSLRNNYKSPARINLRMAEYAVCRADGYPIPDVNWSVPLAASHVWIIDETMFISNRATVGHTFKAYCTASSAQLNLADTVQIEVTVMSHAQCLCSGFRLEFYCLLHICILWLLVQTL